MNNTTNNNSSAKTISPLLKTNGDEAMAIACAAFCIPTSIIIVRRVAVFTLLARERSELASIAARISIVQAMPCVVKLSIISRGYCRKKSAASVISAGKAHLFSTLLVAMAACGIKRRNSTPSTSGTKSNTRFCINNLPTGSSMVLPV